MKKLFINHWHIIALAVLVFSFFLPNLLLGKIPIPADSLIGLYHPWRDSSFLGYNPQKFPVKNPLTTDPILQTYPWRYLAIENIKKGELPLWNPYSFSGQPLLANIQSAPFQVFNMLFLIVPFKIGWAAIVISNSILASMFMYLFLKSLKLSKMASIYGAFIFPFSGFFIAWLTWGTVTITALWLPLILFCINKIFQKTNWIFFLILIFSFTQILSSGHIQTAFYEIFTVVLYLVFIGYAKKNFKTTLLIAIAFLLSVLISFPLLFSSLEFSKFANRDIDVAYYAGRKDWFIPLQNLIQIVAPDFFGNPTTNNYWGVWNYAEYLSFIGILPLFFSLLAIFKKEKSTIFFTALTLISLTLGTSNPISILPYSLHAPFVSSFQPSRIIFLITFSLIVLSSFGLESFLKSNLNRKNIFIFLFLLTPIVLLMLISKFLKGVFPLSIYPSAPSIAFNNLIIPLLATAAVFVIVELKRIKLQNKFIFLAIIIFTALDLFRFSYKFIPFSNTSIIFPRTKTTDFLISQTKPFRVLSTDRRIFNPNSFTPYKIEFVSGYDPLYLKQYGQLIQGVEAGQYSDKLPFNRFITPQRFESNVINLLNVKYVVSFDEIFNQNFEKVFEEGQTKVYKNLNALDRAFFVSEVSKVNSKEDEFYSVLRNQDLKRQAYSQDFQFSGGDPKASVSFEKYDDQFLVLKTTTKKDSALLISNINYPGWKAIIDGTEIKINDVDFIFQSLIVPAGTHSITLKFQPDSFYKSLYFSSAGVLLIILFLSFLWTRKSQL